MEFTDTKTSFDRIGHFRNAYLKVARAVVFGGLLTMFAILLATVLTNQATAQVEYSSALKNKIYMSTYGQK